MKDDNGVIAAFGEIMLRLSAPLGTDAKNCASFDACYGGTEANVLACLSNFGHSVKYLTALPDNGLGEAAAAHLKNYGIDTSDIVVGGDNLGVYFVENGNGSRGANVIYYRNNSEFTRLDESSFDFDRVFKGVKLFHISGISFALSSGSNRLAFALLREAKKRGIKISFDFNYRAKLWSTEKAGEQFLRAVEYADVVLCADLDLKTFLHTDGERFFDKYANAEYLVVRNRVPVSTDKHKVSVSVLRNRGGAVRRYDAPETTFDVAEKVGGGDAFDGAVLHKILCGAEPKEIAEFAVTAFVLKHGIKGDTFTLGERDVADGVNEIFGN